MIKILITGPRTDGISGGQATHMRNLAFISESIEGVDIYFFYTSKGLDGNDSSFNKLIFFIKSILLFPVFCASRQCVHINTSFDKKALIRDFFFILIAKLMFKRVVVQYHGGNPIDLSRPLRMVSRLNLMCLRVADSVVCLTDAQLAYLYDNCASGAVKIKNFVSLPSVQARQVENIDVTFLYMGRMIGEKGIFLILDCVDILVKQGFSKFKVLFCGSGRDVDVFKKQILERDLLGHISYLGNVYGEDKAMVFKQSDCFLYPTHYPEGLPYSILEAMSFALPVVATDVGAISSVVKDHETGIIVSKTSVQQLASVMKQIIENSAFRRDLGDKARFLIEREYSIDAMKKQFEHLWVTK